MLKVCTYNVNSIRKRLHIVFPLMEKVDILCMQETKVEDRKFPEADFHLKGYHVVFSGGKARNGVAIASKIEPDEYFAGINGEKDRIIAARFGKLWVINVYAPQGQSIESEYYKYKLEFFKKLKEFLSEFVDFKGYYLLCGDMNVAPEDIDVHSPDKLRNHVCFHEDAKKAFKEVVQLGFVDILRKHHPEEVIYTFYDYRVRDAVKRGLGWRVDHILATEKLAEKSKDCYVLLEYRTTEKPSDHVPLVAEFEKV